MPAIIQTTLTLLLSILEGTSLSGSQIDTWLTYLVNLLPAIEQEYSDLLPEFDAIIAGLKGQGSATPDQIAALDTMLSTSGADYQAAYAAYLLNHPATGA